MKRISKTSAALVAGTVLINFAPAQTPPAGQAASRDVNRFGVAYRMMFNVSVDFKDLGGYPLPAGVNPGPPTGFQADRVYEDGYNRLDDNLNSYGDLHATRYWGYDRDSGPNSQVIDTAGSRFVEMHATSSEGGESSKGIAEDPQHGFEITYNRELQDREAWRWGLEAAMGYTPFGVDDNRPRAGDVTRLSDRFEVPLDEETGTRYVPPAPYRGAQSEGPLLGSEPMRTISTIVGGAAVTGKRDFSADIFGFRLGPYLEFPLGKQGAITLSGGLALVFVSSDFSYTETVAIAGLNPLTRSGSGSDSDLQLGGFVAGNFSCKLGENWGAFAGAQFQSAEDYAHKESGKKTILRLGQTVFVSVGVNYSF